MLSAFAVAWLALPSQVPSCTPLQRAALEDDVAAMQRIAGRRLLGMGPPAAGVEERSDTPGPCFRRTPLMIAAEHGSVAGAQLLISSGAAWDPVALLPEFGDEALDARCLAIVHGHEPLVALLDKAGATPKACTNNALLFAALSAGRADAIAHQLRAHPSAATLEALLVSAAGKRQAKAIDLVIAAALERKLDFRLAYDTAISRGDLDLVKQLSSGGARLSGGAELAHALAANQMAMIGPLVSAGARTGTEEVRAAVLAALTERRAAVVLALVDTGYRGDNDTPLLVCAIQNVPGIVPQLVKAGVGVSVDDENGTSPLMAAAVAGDPALVRLLYDRGASPRLTDTRCLTPRDVMKRGIDLPAELVTTEPPVPGRAARRLGVTCGAAKLRLLYPPEFKVYLPGAEDPISPNVDYRLEPGLQHLRVVDTDGSERKLSVRLLPSANFFAETFDRTRPLRTLEAVSAPPAEAAVPLELTDVMQVVERHRADAQRCVKVGRNRQPVGLVVMTWRVSAEGEATGVTPVTAAAPAPVTACLREAIKTWKFPAGRVAKEAFIVPFQL